MARRRRAGWPLHPDGLGETVTLTILKRPEPWDAIVVGSGATGGWAALELSRRGLSVLVLEAGGDHGDAPAHPNEPLLRGKRRFDRLLGRRKVQSRHSAYWELDPDLFVVDGEHPYRTAEGTTFEWIRTRALNGRLLTWGGIGVRISDHELRAPEEDGFGEPWPLRYADLAPHFDRIDAFLPVHGTREGLPQLPDGSYVEAPRLTPAEQRFRAAVARAFPDRAVIPSRGVLVRASSRPNGEAPPPSAVRAAVTKHGAALRTDAVVSHLILDADGRASGVAVVDRFTRRTHEISCRSVALCASTLESTRILLSSRSPRHPEGVGASSGALGRYLMDHPALLLEGFVPGARDPAWTDGLGGPKNLFVPRFHNLGNHAGGDFLRGYGMFGGIGRTPQSRGQSDPDEVSFSIVAYGEMLPRAENRVTLCPDTVDAWGIPCLEIACSFSANERALQDHMAASLTEMVQAAGGRVVGPPALIAPGGFVHEVGTARMGHSARTSVVSSFGQCWDAPNVYVMDGATWPTSAWQNPTFTMMAIAGRASEHLATELTEGRL